MTIIKIFLCGCKIEGVTHPTFYEETMTFCSRHNVFNIGSASLVELPNPACPKCNLDNDVVITTESYYCRACKTNFIPIPPKRVKS